MATLDNISYRKRLEGDAFRVVISDTVATTGETVRATLESTEEEEYYMVTDIIVICSHAAKATLISDAGRTGGTEVEVKNSRLDFTVYPGNITAWLNANATPDFEENAIPVGGGKQAIRMGGSEDGGILVLPGGKSVSVLLESLTADEQNLMAVMFFGYQVNLGTLSPVPEGFQ